MSHTSRLARRLDKWRTERRRRAEAHHAHELDCTSLCCAPCGACARVVRFTGDDHQAARLRDLGVIEGAQVSVLRDGDPLLVKVGDARFGIGRSAANHVLCQLCDEDDAMNTTLDALRPGDEAVVSEVDGDPEVVGRLMEMGLLPGTPLKMVRFAPLGDPIEIEARGYHLTLRRAEAAGIHVITR